MTGSDSPSKTVLYSSFYIETRPQVPKLTRVKLRDNDYNEDDSSGFSEK